MREVPSARWEMKMILEKIERDLSVCKVRDIAPEHLAAEFTFAARTDEEASLVCPTELAPADALEREDGWRALRIKGVLDFSLVGILAPIATALADAGVGIFAVSTFNTDYVLVKSGCLDRACATLAEAGYEIA